MESKNKDKINNSIQTAIKSLGEMIDVNTVVGKPIKGENGEYIIPVTKVTLGVLSGGGEYGKISIFKKNEDLPYSAGNGAVISIRPTGFLIKEKGKNYKLLPVLDGPYEKILDRASEFLSKLSIDRGINE